MTAKIGGLWFLCSHCLYGHRVYGTVFDCVVPEGKCRGIPNYDHLEKYGIERPRIDGEAGA